MLQHENETNTCRWAGNVSSANFCSGFTTASSNFLSAPIEHKQALQYPNSLDLLPKELQNSSKHFKANRCNQKCDWSTTAICIRLGTHVIPSLTFLNICHLLGILHYGAFARWLCEDLAWSFNALRCAPHANLDEILPYSRSTLYQFLKAESLQ